MKLFFVGIRFVLLFTALAAIASGELRAQAAQPATPESLVKLERVDVSAGRGDSLNSGNPNFPVAASVGARRVEDTVNLVDTEDAAKYLPSLFLRKRNYGDTQAVMASRVWGVSSSARSLVFADGVPLSALIANNNNIGGPRWGLVAPAEIERIDLMYGPFSAAYAGNSMGAVMEITTRLPERFEAAITETIAWQSFKLYGTDSTYRTRQTAVTSGGRSGRFAFWVSANDQDSFSQPLSYVTAGAFPVGTTGGYPAQNKLGAPADILGASGFLHTRMTNAKLKLAYDLTGILRAGYTFGYWKNDADSSVDTYLRDAAGNPTFAGQSGFASGYSRQLEEHSSHSLSLRTDTKSHWDFDAIATLYRFDRDEQRTPLAATATGTGFSAAGRTAVLGGTGWSTLDVKGTWRSDVKNATHTVTFGAHDDRYKLYNPTFNTADWRGDTPNTTVATEGDGRTRTQALFAQDIWQLNRGVKFTFGGRYEEWNAYDGYNANGITFVHQPNLAASKFSPKATLAWNAAPKWAMTASFGKAYRFATAAELYQLVSTGNTFTAPDPHLKPDEVVAVELKIEHRFETGTARLAFFQDDVHDAIISQFNPLLPGSTQLFSFLSNVDHVRARGVELAIEERDCPVQGVEYSGSLTYLDARTLALSGRASATADPAAAIGKKLPNIPDWRASFVLTYRPDQRWAFTLGGRYSAKLWTTLDNTDTNPNTYQGFAAWFVADAHLNCQLGRRWSASLGIDNLLDRKYFLFHPFPQRTVVAHVKCAF